jgi:ribose transport system substrate-binding protein
VLPNYTNLDGIFMPNESSTSGMLSTLRNDKARHEAVKEGKLAFVGFDGSAILIKALENDELHGIVLQDPFDMGYQSVKRALAHLDGQPAPADRTLYTNLAAIHKGNMNEPKLKALYARDLKQWLDD